MSVDKRQVRSKQDRELTIVAKTFRRGADFGVMSYIAALVAGTARERHLHGCLRDLIRPRSILDTDCILIRFFP